jgi:hypothetical protein
MWQVKRLASTTTQLQHAVKVPGNAAHMRPARSPIESWSCSRALDLPDDGRTDTALLEEIELLTGVVVAATLSPGCLSGSKIDGMWGLGVLSIPPRVRGRVAVVTARSRARNCAAFVAGQSPPSVQECLVHKGRLLL